MRRLWFVLALTACGHPKASGPAWPAPSTTAEDGGESIEPREASSGAAAIEKSAAPSDDKPVVVPAATPAAAATTETPVATAPAATQPIVEDIFTSEDIIIEIED